MPVQQYRYQAHVTDEWQTDTMVVQVRMIGPADHTMAIGQVIEDTKDGMPALTFQPLPDRAQESSQDHLAPTPGIRLRHDVAVAMARAILTEAGKDADEVERLNHLVVNLQGRIAALNGSIVSMEGTNARLAKEVEMLELLVEAKDAHLEREARLATLTIRDLERDATEDDVAQARRLHPARILRGDDRADATKITAQDLQG